MRFESLRRAKSMTPSRILALPRAAGEFRIGAELFDRKLAFALDSPLGRREVVARAEAEYESVRNQMIAAGHEPETAELTMRASTSSSLDVKEASSMVKMLEVLEDLDDVQQVYSNADISEDVLAQL